MIGPWSHSGFLDNRVGHGVAGRRSKFNHLTHILAFFDRCCRRESPPETVAALANAEDSQPDAAATGMFVLKVPCVDRVSCVGFALNL